MTKIFLFIAISFYTICFKPVRPESCQKEKLYGEWKYVAFEWGEINDVEILKRKAADFPLSYTDIFNFKDDSTYTHMNSLTKNGKIFTSIYKFNGNSCEIILGMKRNASQNANFKIIFLDEKYLIFQEDNNPKGVATFLYTKT